MSEPSSKSPVPPAAPKKTYLGDGLYAHDDGYHMVLSCDRSGVEHWVALEPAVIQEFMRFVERSRKVKIVVTRDESLDEMRAEIDDAFRKLEDES